MSLNASHIESLRSIIVNHLITEAWLIAAEGRKHGQVMRDDDNADKFIYNTFVGDIFAAISPEFNSGMIQSLSQQSQHSPINTRQDDYRRALIHALDLYNDDSLITESDWKWLEDGGPVAEPSAEEEVDDGD